MSEPDRKPSFLEKVQRVIVAYPRLHLFTAGLLLAAVTGTLVFTATSSHNAFDHPATMAVWIVVLVIISILYVLLFHVVRNRRPWQEDNRHIRE